MKAKFNPIQFIQKLSSLGERQLQTETIALKYILEELEDRGVPFVLQKYTTYIPKYLKYSLKADGKNIPVSPTGFVSGKIESNFALISNLTSSQNFFYNSNISFNPASKSISRSNHYQAPALAIQFSDIQKVGSAKKIEGELMVEKTKHESVNILVGNITNPKYLVFSHYDSIETGAVDNASGVALSLQLIFENQDLLKTTLFAICGNEELSYDETIYWGHGYRVFEKKYSKLIQKAKRILVLDSFGYSSPVEYKDVSTVILGFPIKEIRKYAKKIVMLSGEFKKLMDFYHTKDDVPELIKPRYMEETKVLSLKLLK